MWSATITSALDSPIVGQGMGSSQQLIERLFPRLGHPHNDYLRVWHDLGAVGVALLIAAMASWVRVLCHDWYEAERVGTRCAIFELSAMLLLVGLMLVMVPDNALIYSFIMGPAGILIGCGLGVRRMLARAMSGVVAHSGHRRRTSADRLARLAPPERRLRDPGRWRDSYA